MILAPEKQMGLVLEKENRQLDKNKQNILRPLILFVGDGDMPTSDCFWF